ncbi:hypothetical protein [Lactobacillus sp. Sy-1]|uniref:hypothetical protein n=1 Tax=Lactobacillus sp. Sy-1 TaxID=2109645 RepID=UPI001C579517|nr:hypothetical protein [Lactobacillus sp. Sy-1]MBW1605064.1 hypothetical protein [Lactobacillus sp. Sy-1]
MKKDKAILGLMLLINIALVSSGSSNLFVKLVAMFLSFAILIKGFKLLKEKFKAGSN